MQEDISTCFSDSVTIYKLRRRRLGREWCDKQVSLRKMDRRTMMMNLIMMMIMLAMMLAMMVLAVMMVMVMMVVTSK